MNEKLCTFFLSQLTTFDTAKLRRMVEKAGGAEAFFTYETKDLPALSETLTLKELDLHASLHDEEKIKKLYEEMV